MDRLKLSPENVRGIFYARIPAYDSLPPAEQGAISNEGYPVRETEHLPQHEDFLDYLIAQGVAAWTRSQG